MSDELEKDLKPMEPQAQDAEQISEEELEQVSGGKRVSRAP